MRKAYVTRYGAFGDHIHCSHVPRLLKEAKNFDYVAFEYNPKGYPIYLHNPWIDEHIHYNPLNPTVRNIPVSFLLKRWQAVKEEEGFDEHISLQWSIEESYLASESTNDYYRDSAYRRKLFGEFNYYDRSTLWIGLDKHIGARGELYFTEEEENIVKGIYSRLYEDYFVVIVNLSGTTKQKLVIDAKEIMIRFLDKHKDAIVITMGDKNVKDYLEFSHPRVMRRANKYPFRQSMLMCKYANLMLGPESGLCIASTLLGAPTIQLMTSTGIKNHGGYAENDHSIQADIYCSPCHKAIYEGIGCPNFYHNGVRYPKCIKSFDVDLILSKMENIYASYRA